MSCISGRWHRPLACTAVFAVSLISCAKHYRAEGVVLKIDEQHRSVTISHRAIPGYMEAMVMPFAVRSPRELEGLTPGARITFRLNTGSKRTHVSRIRKELTGIKDVPNKVAYRQIKVGEVVPDFALRDQRNQTLRLSEFRSRVVAIDFVYTRCPLPDVCPRLSANFARLQRRFGKRVALLSITVDPEFDTPEVLADYARRWGADPNNWSFLTGSSDEVRKVAENFGLVYWAEDGMITHTAATGIIDPDGKLVALIEGSNYTSQQLVDLVQAALIATGST